MCSTWSDESNVSIYSNTFVIPAAVKAGLEVAKEGIDTLDKGIDLYNKILDKVVPWSELNQTITKLDKYRSDYSKEAAALIGEIKTKMMDGMDAYFRATQSVYEWCGLAVRLLTTYTTLFKGQMNQGKFNAQRTLLLKVLDDGIKKMTDGQKQLGDSSSSFNVAAGKLTSLNHRLATDFSQNSEYFQSQISRIRAVAYASAAPFTLLGLSIAAGVVEGKLIPELKAKMASIEKWYKDVTAEVEKSFKNIDDTKAKLKEEIRHIGDLKVQTETTKTYIELDDTPEMKEEVLTSVADLIKKCKEYQNRHMDDVK